MNPATLVYHLFGLRIRQLRENMGWSQRELAARIGRTRVTVTTVELGRQQTRLHDVEMYARIFGMPPKELMKGIWS